MKRNENACAPLAITLAAGLLGATLRLVLYRIGFDHKGILSDTHPLHLICMVLAAAMALYLTNASRKPSAPRAPLWRLIPGLLACGLLAGNAFTFPDPLLGTLNIARLVLAFGCAFCIVASVCVDMGGTASAVACHSVICLYFGLDMLCRYRLWSGNPQLPDYCFHVLACAFLTLSSYHRLAFDVGLGKKGVLRFCSLMALLLCLFSLVGPEPWQFYLAGGCWACANLLIPLPPEQPAPEPEEE